MVMGWKDCHMHDFTIEKQRYALPHPEEWEDLVDESETRLLDVVSPRDKFLYQYDFGDEWEHEILVEKAIPDGAGAPACVAGKRACPPEDSGGPWGYTAKLQALSDTSDDEESMELREWIDEDYDRERFSKESVNPRLNAFFSGRRESTPSPAPPPARTAPRSRRTSAG